MNNLNNIGHVQITFGPSGQPEVKSFDDKKFYVVGNGVDNPYRKRVRDYFLHSDGLWRETTVGLDEKFTGFYATKADAVGALEKWRNPMGGLTNN